LPNDSATAADLETALRGLGLKVWRDEQSIVPGVEWAEAIENGIRDSRAVVVLLTAASAGSEWVNYEYAFAKGARVPIVAVCIEEGQIPGPLRRFQALKFVNAKNAAKRINEGLVVQSRIVGYERASTPTLVAKFQEVNGELSRASKGKTPSYWMDLWLEQVPIQTKSVKFEILDLGFRDRKWTVPRSMQNANSFRTFLTDDMNSYGDVEIWAHGVVAQNQNWSVTSRLYEALIRYYRSRPRNAEIRRALKQIREN